MKTTEERIQEAFADVGTAQGGEFHVPASAADRYIDACVQASLAIVGIEVFRLEGRRLRPDLGQIADFSSVLTGKEGWDAIVQATGADAHRFARQVPSEADVRVNFTLLSEEESRSC
ncbi:MAG: hypothetical protein GY733_10135 [bacterium]|nr:hypothetical protein [bacterium]